MSQYGTLLKLDERFEAISKNFHGIFEIFRLKGPIQLLSFLLFFRAAYKFLHASLLLHPTFSLITTLNAS